MKHFLFTITMFLLVALQTLKAQQSYVNDIRTISINKDVTLHFRSPETVNYIDISTDYLIGDIPIDNIAKIKCLPNDSTLIEGQELGIVSIIGESYLAQYKVVYSNYNVVSELEISQEEMKPTEFPSITMTQYEMKKLCLEIQKKNRKFRKTQSKGMGLKSVLNNIYSFGDYIFVDVTFENYSKIKYDIDQITFRIEDKKIYKATISQNIELKPVYTLYYHPSFKTSYRNVFVFDKFTFPNDKIFRIRLLEKEISGRTLDLVVEYRDLLNSDTF